MLAAVRQQKALRLLQGLKRRVRSHEIAARFLRQYMYVASRSLSMLTSGLVSADERNRIRDLATTLGYGPVPRLPYVPLKELVGPDISIRILEAKTRLGNVRLVDLLAINAIVARFAPRTAFEIGTGDGLTALNIAGNMPGGSRLYTLNLPPDQAGLPGEQVVGERFHDTRLEEQIVQLFGDSTSYDFSRFHGGMDLVFIDANHHAKYVANDSETALRMVRGRNALILWHDYGFKSGVTEAVDRLSESPMLRGRLVAIERTWIACLLLGREAPQGK